MFFNENLDEDSKTINSLVEKWISLEWKECGINPPKNMAYGTHLASYVFCPFGEQIYALNFCWLYKDEYNRFQRMGNKNEGIDAIWAFKFETLKKYKIDLLDKKSHDLLLLPCQRELFNYTIPSEIKKLRENQKMDMYRYPGRPDDVCAMCINNSEYLVIDKFRGEFVWVRLEGFKGSNRFVGRLLNQPFNERFTKHQKVELEFRNTSDGEILVCF